MPKNIQKLASDTPGNNPRKKSVTTEKQQKITDLARRISDNTNEYYRLLGIKPSPKTMKIPCAAWAAKQGIVNTIDEFYENTSPVLCGMVWDQDIKQCKKSACDVFPYMYVHKNAVNVGDLISMDLPPVKKYIDPLLVEKEYLFVEGDKGEGKSTFVFQMCANLVKGTPFLGKYHVDFKTGNILYIYAEMGLAHYQKINQHMIKEFNLQEDEYRRITLMPANNRVLLPDYTRELESAIQHTGARVVILDPILFLAPDYSKTDVARSIRDYLIRTGERFNVSFVLVNHWNKQTADSNGIESAHRGRGGVMIRAGACAFVEIERFSKQRPVNLKRVKIEKTRYGQESEVVIDRDLFEYHFNIVPPGDELTISGGSVECVIAVFKQVQKDILTTREILQELEHTFRMSADTGKHYISRAVKENLVIKLDRGLYQINDKKIVHI